jgi:predicted Zn-dependent peptidase
MSIESREHVMSNGLRIVAEVDSGASSAAAGFFVRTGARDEEPQRMGISHFLEHMVFRGTEGLDGEAIDRAFEDLGASHNAWTSAEVTAFHGHSLAETMPDMLDLLVRIMRPLLQDEDLEDERGVVLEEIAMYEDQPFWQLWEATAEAYYGNHPMGHRVLGTTDSVKAITPEDMRAWHVSRYGSDCTTLALAGRLDFNAIVDRMEQRIGSWTPSGAERVWGDMNHNQQDLVLHSDRTSQGYLIGLAPAPALGDDRRHAAAVLAWLAGRGGGSALHWALVDPGIAEDARIEYEGHDRSGVFAAWSVCEPDSIQEVESTMRRVIRECAEHVTDDDLARARSMIATSVTVHGELPAGRMQRLGRRLATCGDVLPLDEELARIEAVSQADLLAVVDAFPPEPVVLGTLLPEDTA